MPRIESALEKCTLPAHGILPLLGSYIAVGRRPLVNIHSVTAYAMVAAGDYALQGLGISTMLELARLWEKSGQVAGDFAVETLSVR